MSKLISDAWGYEEKAGGGASLGGVEIDVERMMLSQAEATGSVMHVRGLLPFIRTLWEQEKTILVKTDSSEVHPTATDWGPGYERRVVPNPAMSEKRLNRFLIKLGRALAATDKRRALPDWTHMHWISPFLGGEYTHNSQLMKKIVLKSDFPVGDAILLTAAVRDLHFHYPGQFVTDVRTPFPELWENSPYISHLDSALPDVETIECHYPLIHRSNEAPYHVVHGFIEFLNERLGLNIKPSAFKGDIHLSAEEKQWTSQVAEFVGEEIPFWLIVSGGKTDVTVKWWDFKRYQEVVDAFRGRIQFVQIGASGHHHPPLNGVIDLRGNTNLRQLIRLMYHAQGVVCPVTSIMHLAAAVPTKPTMPQNRACVVIAGGREPSQWEAYPHHQFIHVNGALLCCDNGGCWKARTLPLGDGDERDRPENLCVDVIGHLPRCMSMISAAEVKRRVSSYFKGRTLRFLNNHETNVLDNALRAGNACKWRSEDLEKLAFRREAERVIAQTAEYPASRNFNGKGIVICAGGTKYLPCAWVCISLLRKLGCSLPVELWHLADEEMDPVVCDLLSKLDVRIVDTSLIQKDHPARIAGGWELKPYAILHSRFQEVMLLDADNVPVRNPDYLFTSPEYQQTGAVFWPDFERQRLAAKAQIWRICAVPYRDEPAFETGQVLVDKSKCWKALSLTLWYNEHSDFYYRYILGDKETFHLAFRKVRTQYSMPSSSVLGLHGVMCQHDFEGRRLFQHRNLCKWDLNGRNPRIKGFWLEKECLGLLRALRQRLTKASSISTNRPRTYGSRQIARAHSFARHQAQRFPIRKLGQSLVIRAPVDTHTGYGLHARQIIHDFNQMGYAVKVKPTNLQLGDIPLSIRSLIVTNTQPEEWELVLHPPNLLPTPGKRTVYFSMWETTRLPAECLENLNRAELVLVPCEWNASCFSAQGLKAPIRVSPLGIDPRLFRFQRPLKRNVFIFGTAGNAAISGRTRKGLDDVVRAFKMAFRKENDVQLWVKCMPGDSTQGLDDERISVTAEVLTQSGLARWYQSLSCFVSASRAEAWGLMHHQAMAVGRPVIACHFGGVNEFISDAASYGVKYSLQPAGGRYAGMGLWAEPELRGLAEQMRRAYENREDMVNMGIEAGRLARRFTWRRANRTLREIMQEVGALK